MPHIKVYSLLKHPFGLSEILVIHILMPTKREGIRVVGIQLNSPIKELYCLLMFFLQRETVANCDPGLRDKERLVERLVGQIAKLNLLFQMP